MRIIRLSSENVKRLSAVEITPKGDLITIGGKNGAGKSSVLDSIAMAIGGSNLVPTQPIRKGQDSAVVRVDLEDYIITRKFSRSRPTGKAAWGPTKSTLVVSTQDGARYSSPQNLLDKLYGKLTFDPLEFSRERPAKQAAILRELTGLDFAELNDARAAIYARRTMTKRALNVQQVKLATLAHHTDAPKALSEISEFTDALTRADEFKRSSDRAASKVRDNAELIIAKRQEIDGIEHQITALQHQHGLLSQTSVELRQAEVKLKHAAKEAKAAVPDRKQLTEGLAQREVANEKFRDNKIYDAEKEEETALQADIEEATASLELIEDKKRARMSDVAFPVEGLGLEDAVVTFEGLPLEEVASSVQLRVSIAIGLALNPTLKVLLIRNGNLLDNDSLALVAAQAKEAEAQVWMEYVTEDAEGVSVMLEDGHIQGEEDAG